MEPLTEAQDTKYLGKRPCSSSYLEKWKVLTVRKMQNQEGRGRRPKLKQTIRMNTERES